MDGNLFFVVACIVPRGCKFFPASLGDSHSQYMRIFFFFLTREENSHTCLMSAGLGSTGVDFGRNVVVSTQSSDATVPS